MQKDRKTNSKLSIPSYIMYGGIKKKKKKEEEESVIKHKSADVYDMAIYC